MRRCVIIPAWAPDGIRDIVGIDGEDFIVCADGGYILARRENIRPHVLVGDFDSLGKAPSDIPAECRVVRVPKEKNETDAFLCLQIGIEAGCRSFVMAGGIGGRLDHTVAHLQILAYASEHGLQMWMMDRDHRVTMMEPGERRIPRAEGFMLSVLSHSDRCQGVTLRNVKYPLTDAELRNTFPLGISNEFEDREAIISLKEGKLLILLSRDGTLEK